MSYDLHFFTPRPGVDAREIYEREGEEPRGRGPRRPEVEAKKKQAAEALIAHDARLELFKPDFDEIAKLHKLSPAEAYDRYRHLELNADHASGIQIHLHDDTAGLSIPYWHQGEAARRVLTQAWNYIGIICKECGYEVYDPQLGIVIDVNAFDKVLSSYAGATARMEERIGRAPQKKPWWKFW